MGNGENVYGGSEEAEVSELVDVRVLADGKFELVGHEVNIDPDSDLVKKGYANLPVGTVFQAVISPNGRFVRPEDLRSESVAVPVEKESGVVVANGYRGVDSLLGSQHGKVRDLLSN